LIADVIEGEKLAANDVEIDFVADVPAALHVRADPEQLFRVLSNLIRNARQAIQSQGEPGQITVTSAETDSDWTFTVSDTGPGLPEKARENLFTPFQGGIRKGGTGLGLAIAAELVKGHGGNLTLCETGPEGTVFSVILPKTTLPLETAAQ
jgi:signal transduction histidine kinase